MKLINQKNSLLALLLCGVLVIVGCKPGEDPKDPDCDKKDKSHKSSSVDKDGKDKKSKDCPKDPDDGDDDTGGPLPPIETDPTRVCQVDQFKQNSENQVLKKVDILFAMDTSGSMKDDWERVANNVKELVKQMPADTDVRYAVLLGHVGKWRGKLFAPKVVKKAVLDSKTMTMQQITQDLQKMFVEGMHQDDDSSGEALFHSVYHAVKTNAKDNQALGFFRSDAALSILFMSDENEIGSHFPKPQAAGLPDRCDEKFEEGIKLEYYTKKGISLDTMYAAVRALKGDYPFGAHAFVNITKEDLFKRNSKNASCLYDSLGYGYFEIVERTKGVLFSIQANRAAGMAKVGQAVKGSLEIMHEFKLSWPATDVDPTSIKSYVDGSMVAHDYRVLSNTVFLENAGKAGSVVQVAYCKPVPEQPKVWTLVGFGGTSTKYSASLTWKTPELATSGKVRWGTNPSALANEAHESGTATDHVVTVDGLSADTVYYFQAVSKDDKGLEKVSMVIDVRTQPEPVVEEPRVWTLVDFTGTSTKDTVTVSWRTPEFATSGKVLWGSAPNALVNTLEEVGMHNEHMVTAQGLTADTLYYFQAVSKDDRGQEKVSAVISVRTQPEPVVEEPKVWTLVDFAGTSEKYAVTLTWRTPELDTNGKVLWGTNVNNLVNVASEPGSSTNHMLEVQGLSADTVYYFQAVSKDADGLEKQSAVITVRTKAEDQTDPNDPPPNTTWTIVGFDGTTSTDTATLIWQTPGAVTQGVIHMGLSPDNLTLRTIPVPATGESHIVSVEGLTQNTLYYFKVTAVDSHGRTVESVIISKRTKLP